MRSKVNLTLDTEVSAEARQLGLNMSRLAEEAIASAVKEERNRLWREQNKGALEAYRRDIEREGLALSQYRSF